jgi:hypothetical protein
MAVPLSALWLPILLSAVFIFIASNILWMMLPFWHHKDYSKLPDEAAAIAALKSARSGMYIVPRVEWNKQTPEQRAEMEKGPMALVLLRNPVSFSMAGALITWFVYMLVVSTLTAYVACHSLPAGTHYLKVFQIVGTIGILAYSFGGISYTIWYGKPWSVTIKDIIDGVIYGLLMAGTFGWLWPK